MQLWLQIVGALAVLIIVSYLIQWLVPRRQSKSMSRSQFLRWDLAPILGFFGVILLGLSIAAAVQHGVIAEWGWGIALGIILSLSAWVLRSHRGARATRERSSLRGTVQTYGKLAVATAIGLYLSARVVGVALEVLAAAAIGVLIVTTAAGMFVSNGSVAEEKHGK